MMRKPICLSFNLEEINLEVGGRGNHTATFNK